MTEYRRKSSLISVLLSFIFPGAGQLYNEEYSKGLILLAAAIASILSIVHSGISMGDQIMNGDTFPQAAHIIKIVASSLIYFGLWLYGIIDGGVSAQRISTRAVNVGSEAGTEAEPQPKPRAKEGFIGLGVVLIVIGVLSFLSQLGVSIGLIIRYGWPVALILLGCYLLAKTSGILKGGK